MSQQTPHIAAWTLNHGNNNLIDHWNVFSNFEDADKFMQETLMPLEDLHCWAICPIEKDSEPHWTEEGAV